MKAFWHRFGSDFRRSGNVKNEQKRKRVALLSIFGVSKIRRRFGAVLEKSGGRVLGPRESNLRPNFDLDDGSLKNDGMHTKGEVRSGAGSPPP